jgi:hypothetical protein
VQACDGPFGDLLPVEVILAALRVQEDVAEKVAR